MKEPHDGRKCGAQKINAPKGDTCKQPAGYRTDHPGFGRCHKHMGNTPAVARSGFRQMAASMGDPIYTDPAQALEDEIARSAGHVAWLERKVAEFAFPQGDAVIDEDGVTPPAPDPEEGMSPNQRSWYLIYVAERRHLVEVSALALKAGLAKRSIELAERQGQMMANAVQMILDRLNLTDAQVLMVPDVVPDVLRQIARQPRAIESGG